MSVRHNVRLELGPLRACHKVARPAPDLPVTPEACFQHDEGASHLPKVRRGPFGVGSGLT